MMTDSPLIATHIATVLRAADYTITEHDGGSLAAALVADPLLAAILDLAAWAISDMDQDPPMWTRQIEEVLADHSSSSRSRD